MAYVDPSMTGTTQQAKDQFNQVAMKKRGSALSDDEFNTLGSKVGVQGNSVTGQQYNSALDSMGWGDAGGQMKTGEFTGKLDPNMQRRDMEYTHTLGGQAGTKGALGEMSGGGITGISSGTGQTQQQPDLGGDLANDAEYQKMKADLAAKEAAGGMPTNQLLAAGDTGGGLNQQGAGGVTAPVEANAALQQVQQKFSAKFGRALSAQEQEMAMQIARQNGWDGGGQVPAQAMNAVMNAIDTYNGGGTAGGGQQPAPAPAPAPAGSIDPNVAQNQVRDAFKQKFGKDMSPQELQWLISQSGYSGNGPVTEDVMKKAMDNLSRYSGDLTDPFGQKAGGSPTDDAAKKRLEELLKLDYGKVDENSDAIRQQQNAFELQTQRGSDRQRAAMAERAAREGATGSGGYDVMQDALLQQQGEANAGFKANLIAGELQDQRKNLMEAIKLATESGQQDKARALNEKLGLLDIDLRKYLGKGQLGLGMLSTLLGDKQAMERLGLDYAKLQQGANSEAIQALLSGGGY